MKNIFLMGLFIFVLLPRASFGANQPSVAEDSGLAAFTKQQDSDSVAFFQQQASQRADFIKQHADIIAKSDHDFKAWMVHRDELRRQAKLAGNLSPAVSDAPPAIQDRTLAAFVAKQQSDKDAFLARQAQDRQKYLSSQPGA